MDEDQQPGRLTRGLMTAFGEAKLIGFEARRTTPYDDSTGKPIKPGQRVKGTATGGIGHTGPDVAQWIGKTIPDDVIDRWFYEDVRQAAAVVGRGVVVPLTPFQRDTMISFAFNVGPGRKGVKDGLLELKKGGPSTLLRKLNAGDYAAVPVELRKWTKVAGVVWDGLVTRREAEAGLWVKGAFVASGTVQPEQPSAAKAAARNPGVWGGVVTVALGGAQVAMDVARQGRDVAEQVGQVAETVQPGSGAVVLEHAPLIVGALVVVAGVVWAGRALHRWWEGNAL